MCACVPSQTLHLRPHADVAERVLLPGDPGRAMRIAQQILDGPKMLNHNRGLWGYTGVAADGEPLTVQSTGMGGPSAAVVCEELLRLGARRFVRVGTCGALASGLDLGDLVVADAVLGCDGTSRALGADRRLVPDAALTGSLRSAAPSARSGLVVSSDLFYDPDESRALGWRDEGALAVEMEAAAVLAVAASRGAAAACVLAVTDVVATGARISDDGLASAEASLGATGFAALAVGERRH